MIQLTTTQIQSFQTDGFLIFDEFIEASLVNQLRNRFEPLFYGQFETGLYPDKWCGHPELTLPNITREIGNAWKCDRTVASVTLSSEVGRISATLAGWPGARIGQDSLWYKPAGGGKEVALHQDGAAIHYLTPAETMTCWIALDDVSIEIGTLQYVRGSHRWPLMRVKDEFSASQKDYRWAMHRAAEAAGVSEPNVVSVTIPAGGCAFHHGRTWHGSGKNFSTDRARRSLGIHTLSSATQFNQSQPAGYIYGRYQRVNDPTLDESYFPVLWTTAGYRSPHLADYCRDALAPQLLAVSSVP